MDLVSFMKLQLCWLYCLACAFNLGVLTGMTTVWLYKMAPVISNLFEHDVVHMSIGGMERRSGM